MHETRYNHSDRIRQLQEFISAVDELCDFLPACGEFAAAVPAFRKYRARAEQLLSQNFTQTDLNELSNAVVPVINLHKDWLPRMVKTEDGWKEPEYYPVLESLHDKVMTLAFSLRVLGYY